jgi:hypothetical protein
MDATNTLRVGAAGDRLVPFPGERGRWVARDKEKGPLADGELVPNTIYFRRRLAEGSLVDLDAPAPAEPTPAGDETARVEGQPPTGPIAVTEGETLPDADLTSAQRATIEAAVTPLRDGTADNASRARARKGGA